MKEIMYGSNLMGELFLKYMENKTIFVKQINRHKRAVLENIVEYFRLYWHISFICKEHFKPSCVVF
jgi:hypothetical protein